MRFQSQLVLDDEEMEDFLMLRCSAQHAQALCQHFLECDDCNHRLEFNRVFLDTMTASLAPPVEAPCAHFEVAPDPMLYDSTAFYLCPDGLKRLQETAVVSEAELSKAGRTLGVFDETARRALRLASSSDITQRQLLEVVEADPVLASLMIGFANSPLFGASRSIDTLPHAVTFVGVEPTRQLILGAVLRRVMGHDREQWAHAVKVAQSAEALAAQSYLTEPAVAFLAGLVHDIGRLVFSCLPEHKKEVVGQLYERGCPLGRAEYLLFGAHHGEAGASFLEGCRFDDTVVEAVRLHHRPDLAPSPLASVLFLAEHLSESTEDTVSGPLLDCACERAAISAACLDDLHPKPWAELLLAA